VPSATARHQQPRWIKAAETISPAAALTPRDLLHHEDGLREFMPLQLHWQALRLGKQLLGGDVGVRRLHRVQVASSVSRCGRGKR